MQGARLHQYDPAHRAVGAVVLLLPDLPKISLIVFTEVLRLGL